MSVASYAPSHFSSHYGANTGLATSQDDYDNYEGLIPHTRAPINGGLQSALSRLNELPTLSAMSAAERGGTRAAIRDAYSSYFFGEKSKYEENEARSSRYQHSKSREMRSRVTGILDQVISTLPNYQELSRANPMIAQYLREGVDEWIEREVRQYSSDDTHIEYTVGSSDDEQEKEEVTDIASVPAEYTRPPDPKCRDTIASSKSPSLTVPSFFSAHQPSPSLPWTRTSQSSSSSAVNSEYDWYSTSNKKKSSSSSYASDRQSSPPQSNWYDSDSFDSACSSDQISWYAFSSSSSDYAHASDHPQSDIPTSISAVSSSYTADASYPSYPRSTTVVTSFIPQSYSAPSSYLSSSRPSTYLSSCSRPVSNSDYRYKP